MLATCPNHPDHKTFTTTAHVMESWMVNQYGHFIAADESLQTTHGPDKGNVWTCCACGAEAEVND